MLHENRFSMRVKNQQKITLREKQHVPKFYIGIVSFKNAVAHCVLYKKTPLLRQAISSAPSTVKMSRFHFTEPASLISFVEDHMFTNAK